MQGRIAARQPQRIRAALWHNSRTAIAIGDRLIDSIIIWDAMIIFTRSRRACLALHHHEAGPAYVRQAIVKNQNARNVGRDASAMDMTGCFMKVMPPGIELESRMNGGHGSPERLPLVRTGPFFKGDIIRTCDYPGQELAGIVAHSGQERSLDSDLLSPAK